MRAGREKSPSADSAFRSHFRPSQERSVSHWNRGKSAGDSSHSTAVYLDDSLPVAMPPGLFVRSIRGRGFCGFKTLNMEGM
jgi:hypothetical protein